MKLFIADDSEMLQKRLIQFLSDIKNLQIVGTATNSLDALERIEILEPEMLITDIRMPGGGGLELAENIKNVYPNIILIIYTNYRYPQYYSRFNKIGVKYFFDKTQQSEDLYHQVERLCN